MELAIDTSTNVATLALAKEGGTLAEVTWRTEANHTSEVIPALLWLLEKGSVGLEKVQALAIALGPGSYSGLRVGLSIAKGLALAQGIPLVGISTLEAEAFAWSASGMPVRPLLDAGKGDLATALFRRQGASWRRLEEDRLARLEEILAMTKGPTIFCGEGLGPLAAALRDGLGAKARLPIAFAHRHAGSLAYLGWVRLSRGERDNPATLQPVYLRPPSVTLSAKLPA